MAFDDGKPGKALTHGSTVVESDGKEVGKVSAVGEGYFKVDAHHARDFWLPLDLVKTFDDEFTTLTVLDPDLDAHKVYSGVEDLPKAELDGAMSPTGNLSATERRNQAQADYLTRPH